MERDGLARILATHRKELEALGVRSLALFSSVARKIYAEEARKAALEAAFKTLLHHLIRDKVRVEPCEGSDDVSPWLREGD